MKILRAIPVAVVVAFLAAALLGPALAPYPADCVDIAHEFEDPSLSHPLGTGENGVDLLSALLRGARLAFVVSASVVAISLVVGVAAGVAAGWLGGAADRAMVAVTTVLQSFPSILLNMAVVALVARPGVLHVVMALCLNGWVGYARLARGQVRQVVRQEYVTSAIGLGMHPIRVAAGHVLPNIAGPLIVQATYGFAGVILAESSLSFLGLGPARAESWGSLLDQGTSYLMVDPWVALVSGGVMFACILSFNLVGDDARRRWDRTG